MPCPASVVVATYQRRDRVVRLVRALADQCGIEDFEVLVVDDGSLDGTLEAVRREAATLPILVRVLRQETNGGPATARNRGWRESRGAIVAFTDDDCVPAPGWLAALVAGLGGADLVSGPTAPPPGAYDRRGPWSYWIDDDGRSGYFSTCNVAYRREVLDAVGGFDEAGFSYRSKGSDARRCINGEDTDLAWRAIEAGFRAGFAEGARVEHEVFPSEYRSHLASMGRLAGLVLLIKKHPQLRRHFGKHLVYRTEDVAAGAFFAGAAVVAVGAVAGAALGRLDGGATRGLSTAGAAVSLLGLGWYLRIIRERPKPVGMVRQVVGVALGLVADGYAGVVMAKASLRYRTLLL